MRRCEKLACQEVEYGPPSVGASVRCALQAPRLAIEDRKQKWVSMHFPRCIGLRLNSLKPLAVTDKVLSHTTPSNKARPTLVDHNTDRRWRLKPFSVSLP